jgi:DNA-binding CsgD family transcriptional regulator/tetratricopeptide (TPR) repeat protein
MALVGRLSELQALEKLLDAATAGLSGVLVLRGEAGFGKTALLEAAAEAAAGRSIQIARLTGVESETQLSYAGLHRLLLSYADHIDRLPGPQRDALRSTFGLSNGPADRFMVALGVLTLLADVAAEEPLVCLVDDGHWLDPETQRVLGFVARRLDAEQVVFVLATREMESSAPPGDLPELTVRGLSDSEARDLLNSVAAGKLSPHVAGRLIASTGGNPLALIELTNELTQDQLSGVSALPDPIPVGHSLELIFSRQVNRLPPESRLLIALAATEPSASQEALWRAAAELGIDPDVASSQAGDLVAFTPHVTFRHPLVGSVAHHLTPVPQRRRIHQALANVSEKPDRVAWHLAMAASGPDERVAAQLEDTAERARQRGGYAERVSFLAKAAELSVSPDLRVRRLLGAAEAALIAGQLVQARALLDKAEAGAFDDEQVAAALRLSGMVSTATGHTEDAARQHLAAARLLMPTDAPLARRTLLSALTAANYARTDTLKEVTDFACDFLETPVDLEDAASTPECLLFGLVYRLSGSPEKAAPLLRAATDHLRDPGLADDIRMSEIHPHLGSIAAAELVDLEAGIALQNANVQFARRTGGIVVLPVALGHLSGCFVFQGRFDDAQEACSEARAFGEAMRAPGISDSASKAELALLCWRGREKEALDLAESTKVAYERRGEDARLLLVYLTPLELSRGRYREAYNYLLPVFQEDRLGNPTLLLSDLIEAASRCNEMPVAAEALKRLYGRAQASGAAEALGRLARCQALLAEDAAEPLFRKGLALLGATSILTELARTHLLFGEWLRRQRRRREARQELGAAHDLFAEMGADGFAARAGAELEAIGDRPRKRSVETRQTMTPQEARIARLVAQGGTNREVAAELFISPATVDYHLRKVYQKLGVNSRTQLARKMLLMD